MWAGTSLLRRPEPRAVQVASSSWSRARQGVCSPASPHGTSGSLLQELDCWTRWFPSRPQTIQWKVGSRSGPSHSRDDKRSLSGAQQTVGVWPKGAVVGTADNGAYPLVSPPAPLTWKPCLRRQRQATWWLGHVRSQERKDPKESGLHLQHLARAFSYTVRFVCCSGGRSPHLGRDLPAQGSGCAASLQGRFSAAFTPSPQLPLRAELSLSLGRLAVHTSSPPCPAYFLPPFCYLRVF